MASPGPTMVRTDLCQAWMGRGVIVVGLVCGRYPPAPAAYTEPAAGRPSAATVTPGTDRWVRRRPSFTDRPGLTGPESRGGRRRWSSRRGDTHAQTTAVHAARRRTGTCPLTKFDAGEARKHQGPPTRSSTLAPAAGGGGGWSPTG